jgi:hypothetical protein
MWNGKVRIFCKINSVGIDVDKNGSIILLLVLWCQCVICKYLWLWWYTYMFKKGSLIFIMSLDDITKRLRIKIYRLNLRSLLEMCIVFKIFLNKVIESVRGFRIDIIEYWNNWVALVFSYMTPDHFAYHAPSRKSNQTQVWKISLHLLFPGQGTLTCTWVKPTAVHAIHTHYT